MNIIIFILTFLIGIIIGTWIQNFLFHSKEWHVLKWDNNLLGYRPLSLGAVVIKDDIVIMGLFLDTENLPENGLEYTVD
tara:strand:+ start:24 stop:260 length:237 start_codon:yes stop_codon:yes gene_type:complete